VKRTKIDEMSGRLKLNYLECSIFIGRLLDILYLSRSLEDLKIKLILSHKDFNLSDAFKFILSKANIKEKDIS
jgi:hypothetical protein